jgi:hypothetical protein
MESSEHRRRFPPPWRVERPNADLYVVKDANGIPLVQIACRDDLKGVPFYHSALTSDEARRIASAVARLPEFLMQRHGFHPRGASPKRYSPLRPYHVALKDDYVRENWGWINEVCKTNRVPFDSTGERIQRDGSWCVHEFAVQLEAIQFWDQFEGRWLHGEEFIYPERPTNLPKMKVAWQKLRPSRG